MFLLWLFLKIYWTSNFNLSIQRFLTVDVLIQKKIAEMKKKIQSHSVLDTIPPIEPEIISIWTFSNHIITFYNC